MQKPKKRLTKRTGTVTALLLLFALILSLLGAGTMRISMHERRSAVHSANIVKAKTAADAGLTLATHRFISMVQNQSVNLSLLDLTGEPLPNSDATFDSTVNTGPSSTYQIEVTGYSQGVTRTVRTTLKLKGLYDHAILSKGQLTLKAGVLVDGYNSQDPFKTDVDLKLGTTGILADQVILNNGAVLDGKLFIGVGGDLATVVKDLGATTGDRYVLTEEPPFPVITPPVLPAMGSLLVKGATATLTPADSGQYTSLDVKKAGTPKNPLYAQYQVTGGDVVLHITGDISLGQGCEIAVDAGSSLTLYADGDILCATDSGMGYLGNAKEARQVTIYGTAPGTQTFDIKAKTFFTGTIYAPNADIGLNAQGDIYGSFIGNSVQYNAGGDFYYDEDLQNVSFTDPGVRLEKDRWSE